MSSDTNSGDVDDKIKIDVKNVTLKASKKNKNLEQSFWRIFWISNIPKREGISDVRKEYSQVMENMSR